MIRLPVRLPSSPVRLPRRLVRFRLLRAGYRMGFRSGSKRPPRRPEGGRALPGVGLLARLGLTNMGLALPEGKGMLQVLVFM